MTSEPPRVSVCIVSWNVRDDLLECLDSLEAAAEGVSVETLLVDNASTDGTVEAVRARHPWVRVIANEANRGFAAANNQALAEARGQLLLLLNPDTVLPPGALAELSALAEEHPRAGIIGPKLLNPDGSLQHSCRRFPRPRAALFRHTLLDRLFPRNRWSAEYVMADWDHEEAREVDWVSGACMMIRRELYEAAGPLDEGFFWGCEDVDYCFRAHAAGWEVLYAPRPAIVHRIGASTSQVPIRTFVNFHRSMRRLYRKHFARSFVDAQLVSAGIGVRAALLIVSWYLREGLSRALAPLLRARALPKERAGGGG